MKRIASKSTLEKLLPTKDQLATRLFVDDTYGHLELDVDKIREKFMMYISFSGSAAAKAIFLEILFNAVDELRNPLSPGNRIEIEYDEREDIMTVRDNGRGIPHRGMVNGKVKEIFFDTLTTLNSGSNLDSTAKADLNAVTLGRNGVGTLAMTALGEITEVTSYRGGAENMYLRFTFNEGKKVNEESGPTSQHGLTVRFKPSKILGKTTRLIWKDIREELVNFQFINKHKMKMTSLYTNTKGVTVKEEYKTQPLSSILGVKNGKETIISHNIVLNLEDKNVFEEIGNKKVKRFVSMDIAFAYTSRTVPYLDSFCNGNNTIDNGSHLDGALEGICRFFQQITKASLSERDKLDIKWDDVRMGLSLIVSLNTNMEQIFTSQTKHKITNTDLEKLIKDKTIEALHEYFKANNGIKELINIIKTNARARRESDKARGAIVKETLTNWASYKMKNYDPCINKGKEYKELYIIEGDSAKGSLNQARDPQFQALFSIRGVSANVFKFADLSSVLQNREFESLIKVMGCNIGAKFDLNKLNFNKIIIASDADVDGLFIRALLMSFFFKIYPEIIEDGRLFIAEPPLYRVDDKANPFVINKEDYIDRYVKNILKNNDIQFSVNDNKMTKNELQEFAFETSSYRDELVMISKHYSIHERLMEMIIEELAFTSLPGTNPGPWDASIQRLMVNVSQEFPEIYYDEKDKLIKGIAEGKYQSIEISDRLKRKSESLQEVMKKYGFKTSSMILREKRTATDHEVPLSGLLKLLERHKPNILHRFKGLGENDHEDVKTTIMDPNTRSLIKLYISDIVNDMEVFQALRGTSPLDSAARKQMMKEFKITKEMIDT